MAGQERAEHFLMEADDGFIGVRNFQKPESAGIRPLGLFRLEDFCQYEAIRNMADMMGRKQIQSEIAMNLRLNLRFQLFIPFCFLDDRLLREWRCPVERPGYVWQNKRSTSEKWR